MNGLLKIFGRRKKVAKDETGPFGIVQENPTKNTDFLRRTQWEKSLCPVFARTATVSPLEDYIWFVSSRHGDGNNRKKKHCNWWCAACGGQYEWRAPNRILVVQLGVNANDAKVFKARAAPLGLSDNLINALELLANHGDSPIQSIRKGIMEEAEKASWTG